MELNNPIKRHGRRPILAEKALGEGKRLILLIFLVLGLVSLVWSVNDDTTDFITYGSNFNLTFSGTQSIKDNMDLFPIYYRNMTLQIKGYITSLSNFNKNYGEHYWTFNNTQNDTWRNENISFNESVIYNSTYPTYNVSGNASNASLYASGTQVGNISSNFSSHLNMCGNSSGSISFWVYFENTQADRRVFEFGKHVRLSCGITAVDEQFRCFTDIGATSSTVTHSPINKNVWYHVAYTYDNHTGYRLYINGSLKDNSSILGYCDTPYSMNKLFSAYDGSAKMQGSLDELRFYNITLSDKQVQNLYNYGTINLTNPHGIVIEVNESERFKLDPLIYRNVSFQASFFRNILDDGCIGGETIGQNCRINWSFYSSSPGTINIEVINTTGSYGFGNCSHNFGIPSNATALNLSIVNETTGKVMTGDIDGTIDYYYTGGSTNTYTIDETNVRNHEMCIYPDWAEFYTDIDIAYENEPRYPQRNYITSSYFLDDVLTTIELELLGTDTGRDAYFKTIDEYEEVLVGVNVVMKNADTSEVIESRNTDDSGIVAFWVDPDVTYTFTFTLSGYESETVTLRPVTNEIYNVVLNSRAIEVNQTYASGISYKFRPTNSWLNNDTTYRFGFNLTSNYWDITACSLYLKNSSDTISSTAGYTARTCNLSISYNTGSQTRLYMEAIYELNGTQDTVYKTYDIGDYYQGQFSFRTFIDDITDFDGAGFNDNTRLLISFVFIFALSGLASKKLGFINPEHTIILIMILTFVFSYIGWMQMNIGWLAEASPDTPANVAGYVGFLRQYAIFLISLLSGMGYIIMRHNT